MLLKTASSGMWAAAAWICLGVGCATGEPDFQTSAAVSMEKVIIDRAAGRFVLHPSRRPFVVWGVNYDHDEKGRLIEDYWFDQWEQVVEDFDEIRALGANTVRIHLQLGRFMEAPNRPNRRSLVRLERLIRLAERKGLYLNLTGLGCYHKKDVPGWYDRLSEADRWAVQARFWEAVAGVGAGSPAVFCYDLMNEPILPGKDKTETEWLAGELGGKHFVQRISLDLAGRTQKQVAAAWVRTLAAAIRKKDSRTPITV
ncbi:MAG: cellulase family glycosylhydrolase, partial [Phycisphaeraceae bacterium]|nr:cellulase family glycosylhydrolase [Phycisphaeraceae bacterium]